MESSSFIGIDYSDHSGKDLSVWVKVFLDKWTADRRKAGEPRYIIIGYGGGGGGGISNQPMPVVIGDWR